MKIIKILCRGVFVFDLMNNQYHYQSYNPTELNENYGINPQNFLMHYSLRTAIPHTGK